MRELSDLPAFPDYLRPSGADGEADALSDMIRLHSVVERLKLQKRSGWYRFKLYSEGEELLHALDPADIESIAGHMYRMALLSLLVDDKQLDMNKVMQLCLVHDIAEALTGDIAPFHNVQKHVKHEQEVQAMQFISQYIHSDSLKQKLNDLWTEYESRETNESKLVKSLDRYEFLLQVFDYERRFNLRMGFNFKHDDPLITHSTIIQWNRELIKQRNAHFNA